MHYSWSWVCEGHRTGSKVISGIVYITWVIDETILLGSDGRRRIKTFTYWPTMNHPPTRSQHRQNDAPKPTFAFQGRPTGDIQAIQYCPWMPRISNAFSSTGTREWIWSWGGGRICTAFTQCKKCQNFVLLLIPKQYHLKCTNNINIVLYLGFADIILVAFNKIEIFIQDTGYRTCGVSPLNRHS